MLSDTCQLALVKTPHLWADTTPMRGWVHSFGRFSRHVNSLLFWVDPDNRKCLGFVAGRCQMTPIKSLQNRVPTKASHAWRYRRWRRRFASTSFFFFPVTKSQGSFLNFYLPLARRRSQAGGHVGTRLSRRARDVIANEHKLSNWRHSRIVFDEQDQWTFIVKWSSNYLNLLTLKKDVDVNSSFCDVYIIDYLISVVGFVSHIPRLTFLECFVNLGGLYTICTF